MRRGLLAGGLALIMLVTVEFAGRAQNIDTAFTYYKAGKFDRAAYEFVKILPYLQKAYGLNDTTYYTYYLFYTGDCFSKDHQYTRAEVYFERAREIYERKNARTCDNYLIAINKLAEAYNLDGKFRDAEKYYLLALDLIRNKSGEESAGYLVPLGNLATLYQRAGEYSKAGPLILKCLEISEKLFGSDDPRIGPAVNNAGAFYDDTGDYTKAQAFYLRALSLRLVNPGKESPEYAISANNLAEIYSRTGRDEEAEALYLSSLAVSEKISGRESSDYAITLNNLGALYQNSGKYDKAESCFVESAAIKEKIYGSWSPVYASTLNNLALLYQETGNFAKSEPLYLKALEIRKISLGETHPEYGIVLNNLALFYAETGREKESEEMLRQVLTNVEKSFGTEHVNYAVSLNNLALFYSDKGDFGTAESMLKKVLEIYRKTSGEMTGSYAQALNNLAEVYDETGRDNEAESMFLESLDICRKTYGENHPDYSSTLCNLALFYQARGLNEKAAEAYRNARKSFLEQMRQQFGFMSEGEKEKYLSRVRYFFRTYLSFILNQQEKDPSLAGEAYDIELTSKGLLLNSDKQIRNFILNSGDSAILGDYDKWIGLRASLAREYSLPLSAQRNDLNEIETAAGNLEKQITRFYSQKTGIRELQSVHWQDVEQSLKRGEAAIEFTSFPYFDGEKWRDSTIYAALILRKGDKWPAIVRLFEARQLESLLAKNDQDEAGFINSLYSWPGTGNRVEDEKGEKLYHLVWQPVEKYLKGISTVLYSATGRLHQLSFSAVPCSSGKMLSDKYRLCQLSSTSQVVISPRSPGVKDIELFGGIDYDAGLKRGEGSRLEFLEGSLKEVQQIADLAGKSKKKAVIFSGGEATEKAFKNLSGKSSPSVMHISTHGFFYPDPNASKNMLAIKRARESSSGVFRVSDNPLMRSGLAFAGANRLWSAEKTPPDGDDGILTAYEVSNMYLPSTSLAVLSACETGLGEVRGSEGVFGLQRAFRIAGAKNIIMSLWEIPDYQTSELMEVFYRKWFSGRPVADAFRLAQNYMKKKYPGQPYLWAAFVLLK